MNISKVMGIAVIVATSLAGAATAQDQYARVALYKDWSVFASDDKASCFIASKPTSTEARRNGQDVTSSVRRGDIHVYITTIKNDGLINEVSFAGGYPFRDGSTVSMQIGSDSFELFTEGEWAWPTSPDEDRKVVGSMRRGTNATITGVSGRGTTTKDRFSLIGFSDALKDANDRSILGTSI